MSGEHVAALAKEVQNAAPAVALKESRAPQIPHADQQTCSTDLLSPASGAMHMQYSQSIMASCWLATAPTRRTGHWRKLACAVTHPTTPVIWLLTYHYQ